MRILFIAWLICPLLAQAQFDPAGGEDGSKAVHFSNSSIGRWADSIQIRRSYVQINDTSLGRANTGSKKDALGVWDTYTLSLGDGGEATLFFDEPIQNIKGPDFAVFENGFPWFEGYFLELAFVEVSTDGINFVRFRAESLADTNTQFSNNAAMKPEQYHNLAGKHQGGYGTPFDLEELRDSMQLDINAIHFVRLVDVVGSVNDSFAQRDAFGRKVNDPWPTPFASGGFDLDAVGVLTQPLFVAEDLQKSSIKLYPNPVKQGQTLHTPASQQPLHSIQVYSMDGSFITSLTLQNNAFEHNLSPGLYLFVGQSQDAEHVKGPNQFVLQLCVLP